ncbi:IS66 family transposase [Cognatishimia sp.]|uniref:IS66 family transposase n=1 Tax=Cognatishimia sp. TaxID=2211648 RepID=UPI0035126EF4
MFDALKSLDLTTLPSEVRTAVLAAQTDAERQARQISALAESNASIAEQNAALVESNATFATQNAELEAVNARLEHMVKELNHLFYGPKSERFTEDERQLAFEDLEVATAEAQAQSDTIELTTPRKKRRPPQRNLGNLPDHLERIEQVIEPDSIVCPCGCGEMVKIGEDRSERLDIVPAQFRVIVTVRPKYACPNKDGGVTQAPSPDYLIEGGLPTEAFVAYVGVCKYADHNPLYRQSQIYARSGLHLDRATLASWMGKMSFHLAPVVDHMFKDLKKSDKLFADETRCPVLDPGRGRTKTSYLWAIARDDRPFGGTAPPGVVFCYADGRGGKHATDFLTGFSGTLQVDGYAGYNALAKPDRKGGPVKLAYCWAHARRKLKEVHDRDGSPIAAEGLKRIKAFYKVEAEIRGQSPETRRAVRQEKTAPLMADFEDWLRTVRARISRKSRLGEKLSYIAKHMEGLKLFLDDGAIEMDSNTVERTIRPIALNRKNALFAGHDEGGRTWGRIASLIETCKLNGVEPYAYLKATLEAIAQGHPASRIEELMPWNFDKKG